MNKMKKTITLLSLAIALHGCAQKQEQYNTRDMEITDHYKNYKYLNNTRPGYYLQANNQNCYYDIRINDGPTGHFFDEYPAYSVRLPINYEILKSGEQKLSVKIFPFQGDTLSAKANLQLRLMRYPDMTDMENDFGGSTVLWEWELPDMDGKNLPLFAMDTVFEADVPYDLNVLNLYAEDLSKMDEKDLLLEVVSQFKNKRDSIINRTQNESYLLRHIKRSTIQIYGTKEEDKEVADGMLKLGQGKEPQPLENYELKFYYNTKIVTLVRKKDKEPAIWFMNTEKTAASEQPYYIFKHKETGEWHMW